jgi:small subunit ribosomal protein S21
MGKPINVEVRPKNPNEPFERMVKRFNKKVKKEKIFEEVRERMHHEKPSIKKRRKKIKSKRIIRQIQKSKEE